MNQDRPPGGGAISRLPPPARRAVAATPKVRPGAAEPPLHASPAAGFEQPFEMLAACHERVERMLGLLERLAAHLAGHGCDDDARQAARDVMRYFDTAGPAHHEDEERHVFPALRGSRDPQAAALASRLEDEHATMAGRWPSVRAALEAVDAGRWDPASAARATSLWSAFAALYRRHLALEEAQAYPLAQPLLDDAGRAAMGAEMARRRGLR